MPVGVVHVSGEKIYPSTCTVTISLCHPFLPHRPAVHTPSALHGCCFSHTLINKGAKAATLGHTRTSRHSAMVDSPNKKNSTKMMPLLECWKMLDEVTMVIMIDWRNARMAYVMYQEVNRAP